jgi:hypothetical protein
LTSISLEHIYVLEKQLEDFPTRQAMLTAVSYSCPQQLHG